MSICPNVKVAFFVSSLAVLMILAEPAIFSKLYNLILSVLAAVIGVLLGLFIATKTINTVVKRNMFRPQNLNLLQSERQNRTNQQSMLQHNESSLVSRTLQRMQGFYESILKGLSRSPVIQAQMQDPLKVHSASISDKIRLLGQVPDRATQAGSYVCVSQSVDMMMYRVFEYCYRDYVETWYTKVSSDRGRLHKLVKSDFWQTFRVLTERLSKVDVVNLVMNRYIRTLQQHFQALDATDPLKKNQNASFKLHPCLRHRTCELEFLRRICNYIIKLCFPEHIAKNSSSKLILREILSGLAFLPAISVICDPDYINLTLLKLIQTREFVEEEKTRAYMYAATYEDFIKIINEADSIAELQQIRYRIMTEVMHATTISRLKKDNRKPGKARSMAKGELLITRNLKRYINQCQVAKQQCEKRIRALGGDGTGSRVDQGQDDVNALQSQILLVEFSEVMGSPMARSYLMKYLKSIGHASLLKYWNEIDIIYGTKPAGKELAKLVSHVYQTYIRPGTSDELPLEIDRVTLKGMQTCVIGNKGPEDFYKIQEQVYKVLEKDHYPSFLVSDFYVYQLMPHISDDEHKKDSVYFGEIDASQNTELGTAAFGSRKCASDGALKRLQQIEDKLEYKAQALESLKPGVKQDLKVTRQLEQEISELQKDKLKQQLHMERAEAWWSKLGKWNASIDKVQLLSSDGESSKVPVYTIVVVCSGVPYYEVTDDVSGWVVVRNLTEFQQLHQSLKELCPWLKKRRIPNLPLFRLRGPSDKFLQNSKEELNNYLKDVLQDEILNCSELVYAFLSQTPDQSYEQLKGKQRRRAAADQGAVDHLSDTGVRKKSLWQIGGFFMSLPKDILDFVLHSEDAEDISDIDEIEDGEESIADRDSIAGPLYELISEVFEIQGLFRPLRKTLIIFVRIAFGGTINKQIRDTLQWLVSESMVTYYLQTFIDSMWPNGWLKEKSKERTEDEKMHTALEVQVKLLQNIPEAFQSLVGQENARRGMLKIYRALQDEQLNKHIFYSLLSETVEEVFPEIIKPSVVQE